MFLCNLRERLPRLLVLEGMQQGDGAIETRPCVVRARSFKLNRADFLFGEGMMVPFVCPSHAD
jgi:hypothetical protein